MGIAAAGARLADRLGYPKREDVFARGVGAVQHFDSIDELEDGELGRLLRREGERFFALSAEVDGVEVVAERVGDDEEGALFIGDAAQRLGAADAADVLAQAEGEDVAEVGRNFHAVGDEQVGVFRAELLQDMAVPEAVVFGHVDAGEAARPSFRREVLRVESAVGGAAGGVDVHIDDGAHRVSIASGVANLRSAPRARGRA